ncbi:phospholipase A-2-activating protein, partial [Tremellales sp. Uapishka_1]
MATPYQLAFTLHGHSADVRNLCGPHPSIPLLLSASRDGSAIVWGPSQGGREWEVKMRAEEIDKRYVSCVGMTKSGGEAFLLMGSNNGILTTYQLPSNALAQPPADYIPTPYHTLVEHNQNLCCMDVSAAGLIGTGSWDKTVVIWKDFKKVITIKGHQQAVWAVKFVGEDRILTASADKSITLHLLDFDHKTATPLQTYSGHTDCVRGLSLRPNQQGFWSCGNDGLVNLYTFDKTSPVASLSGHTSFVYSVSAFPDGSGAISTGEDGFLRVWSESELVQSIPHPSLSLWSSAIVPNPSGTGHYLASSSSDSTIRFFTHDVGDMAVGAEKEDWEREVAGRKLDKSQVGDVKHSDLPGMEALGREGKKDGQVIMIKNNDQVEAYQWSAPTSTWQQIGQVVDAIGSGRKQLYEGKEWDHVFDVDVSEGMPPLKLPYNVSENPWSAAARFLTANELPQSYLDEVVAFIQKNTNGVQLGAEEQSTYVDPYTGTSRYTGSSSSSTQPTSGGGDPYTGGSAYSSTPRVPEKKKGVLPVKTWLHFKTGNVAAAKTKINELISGNAELDFSSEDGKNVAEIYAFLSTPVVALPSANSTDRKERFDPERFLQSILSWPEDKRFPLLDIARLLAVTSPTFPAPSAISLLLRAGEFGTPWQSTKARETNSLLVLRALGNLCNTRNGRSVVAQSIGEALEKIRAYGWEEIGGAARKLALGTLAVNLSIMAVDRELKSGQGLLELISFILDNEKEDSETIYRASIALGNLIFSPAAGSLQVGGVQSAKGRVGELAQKLNEKRLTELASEIESLGA